MRKLLLLVIMLSIASIFSSPVHAAYGDCAFGDCGTKIPKQVFTDPSQDLGNVIDTIEASGVATQLNLAPGTYTECAIAITVPVNLSIVGSGVDSTIINCSTNAITNLIDISGQDGTSFFGLSNLSFYLTSSSGNIEGLHFDQSAGTTLSSDQFIINNVKGVVSGVAQADCVRVADVALNINGLDCSSTSTATNQNVRALFQEITGGVDEALNSYISGSYLSSVGGANSSAQSARGMMLWFNDGTHSYANNVYVKNTVVKARVTAAAGESLACYCVNDDAAGAASPAQSCYYDNVTCLGDGSTDGTVIGTRRAIRVTSTTNANVTAYYTNVAMHGSPRTVNLQQISGSASFVKYRGLIVGAGAYFDGTSFIPDNYTSTGAALDSNDLIYAVGQAGNNNASTSGTSTSGEGADVLITSGVGGSTTATTGAGVGGTGGDIVFTAAAGGAQTNASGTTNVGGAGGYIELEAGDGGIANSGSSTDTGGAGQDIYLKSGAGGVGTDATGSDGHIYLGVDSADNVKGNVAIGMTNDSDPEGPLVVVHPTAETITAAATITANGCGTIKAISSAGAVTTNTTNTFTAPAAGNKGCCMDVINVGANNITLDANGNFISFGGLDVVLTQNDAVRVCQYNNADWYQTGLLVAN